MVGLSDFVNATDLANFKAGDAATIVRQVQQRVRSYCGWHIAPQITETVKVPSNGSRELQLPSLMVAEIISIDNAGTTVDVDNDIDWDDAGLVELLTGWWSPRLGKITATIKHGYVEPPADLVGVISAVAARAIDSPSGRVREHAGQVDITFGTAVSGVAGGIALLEHELETINLYKL